MTSLSERPVLADLAAPAWLNSEDAIPELLATVPLFEGLAPAALAGLTSGCTLVDIPEGTRLIHEGELGDEFYVVIRGRLQAVQRAEGQEILLRELSRGASVGEVALLETVRRTASVVAVEPSRLIALKRGTFDAVLHNTPEIRTQLLALVAQRRDWEQRRRDRPGVAELLRRLAALTGIEDVDTLRDLEKEVSWITMPANTCLFKKGDEGDALYFVVDGELDLFVPRGDGSRMRLDRVVAGAILGEMALLTDAPRSADAVASNDATLLRLSRKGYEALVRSHPQTTVSLSRALATRLAAQLEARTIRTQLGAMPIATDDEIRDIVATPDLVLRNLRITQMYFQLSLQLAGLLGQQDANWCTFATHASKTAGYSIRKEELPGYGVVLWLEDNVARMAGIEKLANGLVDRLIERSDMAARMEAISAHISNCISAGNLKVFAELAPIFSAFLRNHQNTNERDPAALQEVLALLEPGDVAIGGQQLLATALGLYCDAIFEPDAKKKSEMILLANCQIGLHEQTRLQPYIVEALDTPVGDLLDGIEKSVTALTPRRVGDLWRRGRARIGPTSAQQWRQFATRTIMSLRLPYGDLSLGRDLPRLPNRQVFPDVLEDIELDALRAVVKRFDRTKGALRNSRAVDWGNLDDRMNTILNLFRSRQKSYELFRQPFQYEQRKEMLTGVVPRGRL